MILRSPEDAVISRNTISSAPSWSYSAASSTGSPASLISANRTPLTTRPSSTSRQGMIRFAGTRPQYVTHASAQVGGAHADRGLVATIARRACKRQEMQLSGRAAERIAERAVLNVDREPPGRMTAATPDQLGRGRTGENPQTLDQWAVGGARRLSGGQAGADHRIASLT